MTTAEHQQTQSANQDNEMAAQLDLAHVLLEANSVIPTQERTQVLASYILDGLMKAQEEEGLEKTKDGKIVKPEEGFFTRLEDGLKDGSLLPELEKKADSATTLLPVSSNDSELITRVQSAVTTEREKQMTRLDKNTRREMEKRQKIADVLERKVMRRSLKGKQNIEVGTAKTLVRDTVYSGRELSEIQKARRIAVGDEVVRRLREDGVIVESPRPTGRYNVYDPRTGFGLVGAGVSSLSGEDRFNREYHPVTKEGDLLSYGNSYAFRLVGVNKQNGKN